MKVLMPYVDIGNGSITEKSVSGGTELFSRLIAQNFDIVTIDIPWNTTPADNKKYVIKMRNLIEEHKIDLLLSNNIKAVCCYGIRNIGIPIMHITHTNYGLFTANETLAKMVELGHSVFAVSQYNKIYFDNRAERLEQPKVNFAGIVNPAYCQHDIPVNTNPDKRIITVGRSNSYKHPFVLHKMVKNTGYDAEVITSVGVDNDSVQYYEKNKHLSHKLKLPHEQVIQRITDSAALVITCMNETFGITALEALSVGTPVIIRSDVTGTHASAEIAASQTHRVLIRKSNETKNAMDMLSKVDRNEIKQLTQLKHSKKQWITNYQNAFDKTIEVYKKINTSFHHNNFFTF
jgi:glycosyltransferase involved in cell wall biosynthesis